MLQPRISITVVTCNRPDSLESTLASIAAQNFIPWEIVVSDDSNEEHVEQVRGLARSFGAVYVSGPRRGLYANRNHAAKAATGTHIRTMDDDHLLPTGHLEACQLAVASDPEAVWTVGEFHCREVSLDVARSTHPACPPQFHARGFGVTPRQPEHSWALADGSTIFPAGVWERGEGYYEGFPFGALFYELGSRLHWLGYRTRFLKDTFIWHDHRRSPRSIDSEELDQATRYFAMLCHSWIYQPVPANRLWSTAEVMRDMVRSPAVTRRALRRAWAAFQDQRNRLSPLQNAVARPSTGSLPR